MLPVVWQRASRALVGCSCSSTSSSRPFTSTSSLSNQPKLSEQMLQHTELSRRQRMKSSQKPNPGKSERERMKWQRTWREEFGESMKDMEERKHAEAVRRATHRVRTYLLRSLIANLTPEELRQRAYVIHAAQHGPLDSWKKLSEDRKEGHIFLTAMKDPLGSGYPTVTYMEDGKEVTKLAFPKSTPVKEWRESLSRETFKSLKAAYTERGEEVWKLYIAGKERQNEEKKVINEAVANIDVLTFEIPEIWRPSLDGFTLEERERRNADWLADKAGEMPPWEDLTPAQIKKHLRASHNDKVPSEVDLSTLPDTLTEEQRSAFEAKHKAPDGTVLHYLFYSNTEKEWAPVKAYYEDLRVKRKEAIQRHRKVVEEECVSHEEEE